MLNITNEELSNIAISTFLPFTRKTEKGLATSDGADENEGI